MRTSRSSPLLASQEQDELEARTHVSDTLCQDSKVESCAAPEASGAVAEASSPELSDEQVRKAAWYAATINESVEIDVGPQVDRFCRRAFAAANKHCVTQACFPPGCAAGEAALAGLFSSSLRKR